MKIHVKDAVRFLFVILFSLAISGCSSTLWKHKDFDSFKSGIKKVVIISPSIEYFDKGEKDYIARPELSAEVEDNISFAIEDIIKKEEISASRINIVDNKNIAGSKIFYDISQLRKKCWEIIDSMNKSGVRNPTTISEMDSLEGFIKADAIICVRGKAYDTPRDARYYEYNQTNSFQMFFDHPYDREYQYSGMTIEIALIDVNRKSIVWYDYNLEKDSKYDTFNKESVKNLCTRLLKF